jgi:hypothetical protein
MSALASERPRAQASPMRLAPSVTTAAWPVRSRFITGSVSVKVGSAPPPESTTSTITVKSLSCRIAPGPARLR